MKFITAEPTLVTSATISWPGVWYTVSRRFFMALGASRVIAILITVLCAVDAATAQTTAAATTPPPDAGGEIELPGYFRIVKVVHAGANWSVQADTRGFDVKPNASGMVRSL